MLWIGSSISIIDNSGAKEIRCFRIFSCKTGQSRFARLGETIRGSVRRHIPHKKVHKGDLLRVLLIQVKKKQKRMDGSFMRYGKNVGVVLRSSGSLPLGTRIKGKMSRQFRRRPLRNWIRLRSIALGFV